VDDTVERLCRNVKMKATAEVRFENRWIGIVASTQKCDLSYRRKIPNSMNPTTSRTIIRYESHGYLALAHDKAISKDTIARVKMAFPVQSTLLIRTMNVVAWSDLTLRNETKATKATPPTGRIR
jgi:hypothetical protein